MPALVDRISEDSVDANRGEDNREHCEAANEQHNQPSLRCSARDSLLHGLDVEDGLFCIGGGNRLAHSVRERCRIVPGTQSYADSPLRHLGHGNKSLRLNLLFQPTVPYVVSDADNRPGLEIVRTPSSYIGVEPLTQRVPLKESFGESAVHNGDQSRTLSVVNTEPAALEYGCSNNAEIIRRDANQRYGRPMSYWRGGYSRRSNCTVRTRG